MKKIAQSGRFKKDLKRYQHRTALIRSLGTVKLMRLGTHHELFGI